MLNNVFSCASQFWFVSHRKLHTGLEYLDLISSFFISRFPKSHIFFNRRSLQSFTMANSNYPATALLVIDSQVGFDHPTSAPPLEPFSTTPISQANILQTGGLPGPTHPTKPTSPKFYPPFVLSLPLPIPPLSSTSPTRPSCLIPPSTPARLASRSMPFPNRCPASPGGQTSWSYPSTSTRPSSARTWSLFCGSTGSGACTSAA